METQCSLRVLLHRNASYSLKKTHVTVAIIVCKAICFHALVTHFTRTFKYSIKHLARCNYSTLNGLLTHLWLIVSSNISFNDYCLPLDYTRTSLWHQAWSTHLLLRNGSGSTVIKPGLLSHALWLILLCFTTLGRRRSWRTNSLRGRT